ncbi:MAG: aminotransferase class I/II-fold pyridoxal phosphate-dependent enzyme [Gemmatimonadetes bacterium]|nr:aminotransferase class I/II-fold pyridoxal phosphate-dependent enzyme [Gemmatimonadota bacterium]
MIDLRSDTVTRPTPEMRQAIASAVVGDDYLDGDPTTRRLEEEVARRFGKERGLFFPSGTMANQGAIWALGEPGTELYVDRHAHIVDRELAAASALAGMQLRTVEGDGPMMDAVDLEGTIRHPSPFFPRATLLCLENTHNSAGGMVIPRAGIQAMSQVARRHGMRVHLDGARLWNACVATGTGLAEFGELADTVMVSFSKGLGAPAGAVLVGDAVAIGRADEHRKRLGGVMRQSGILAAGCLHGLEYHLDRLVTDHHHAAEFAAVVDRAIAASVVPPETNIVMIDLAPGMSAHDVAGRAREAGVAMGVWTSSRLRTVFHLDVSAAEVQRAGEVVLAALDESWRALGDTSEWPVAEGGGTA